MEKITVPDHTTESSGVEQKGPDEGLINPSGHRQELDRNFHLINICGLGLTSGNTWIAIGGSIVSSFLQTFKDDRYLPFRS
jgi:choline transport protein